MKKLYPIIVVLCTLLSLNSQKVYATHAAGAELVYQWISDSTYQFYYHFYRDCIGIPEPDSVAMCWFNSCDPTVGGSIWLDKSATLTGGDPNGTQVLISCPGKPTSCDVPTSTLPGYEEWWYGGKLTLPSRCNYWTFNVSISARNSAIKNITPNDLYTEATFDNLDAQGNSSPYFTVKPVPYICVNVPYTYNNGAYDPNNDSIYYEFITPETDAFGTTCPIVKTDEIYQHYKKAGDTFSLFNPLPITGTFFFSDVTGQMSFTPREQGIDVVTVKVHELRHIPSLGPDRTEIGTVMRDIEIQIIPCDEPQPAVSIDTSSVVGATFGGDRLNACATQPFSFDFSATSSDTSAVLVASDNSSTIMPKVDRVTYTGFLTDSITGHFSWTPGLTDTGLKVLTITVKDSNCKGISFPLSQTFSIPIYVWPRTKILSDTSICPGDTAKLRAIGGGGFVWGVVPGGSPLSTLSCDSCDSVFATPSQTTQYWVRSSLNTYCGHVTDTVTVVVVPPMDNVRIDTATCVHDSVQLNIPMHDSAYLTHKIKWAPTAYLSNDTIPNPICTPLSTMQYFVTVTYNKVKKCQSVDTVSVRYLKGFTLFNGDTSVCKNTAIKINALGDSGYTYVWTPATNVSDPNILNPVITADTAMTYTLTASHPGCTDSFKSISISVEPVPLVVAGVNREICSGDTVHLFPTVTPDFPDYSYSWTPAASVNNPALEDAIFTGTKTTEMTFTASTPDGCKGKDSLHITVFSVNFLTASADTAICPGDTAHLRVSGDSIAHVLWTPAAFLTDTNTLTTNAYPLISSTYTVYGVNVDNCRDTVSVSVAVKAAAVIDLPDSVTIYPGESYQISPEGNCLYFSWFPPLGLSSDTISNPVASPDVNTRYIVNGETEGGCKAKDSMEVYVSLDSYINVPNAFSPGNGPNNILKVVHTGEATLKSFVIYDRWGQKLFETSDINEGWDGTFNGQPQPMGVYVYVVEAYTFRGKRFYKQGNITLLR